MHATTEAILQCRLSNWLDAFRQLCYPRELIKLPQEFVQYLVSDGVFVQGDTQLVLVLPCRLYFDSFTQFGDARDEESESDDSSEDSSANSDPQGKEFPELTMQIQGHTSDMTDHSPSSCPRV